MNHNVLICLQQMGIGGVETVVLNQIQLLISKNKNVIVIGKIGAYTEQYEKLGAKCIDFNFELNNLYDNKNIGFFYEICISKEIKEVYIHSTECVPYIFPSCVLLNIPYVAYIHGGYKEIYEWYIKNYDIYNFLFPLYFNNAYKIIAISETSKNNIIKMFNIKDSKKFKISLNSLNFDYIEKIPKEYKNSKSKFLIISRIAKDKGNSIINSLKFFQEYKKYIPEAQIAILGKGNAFDDIKKYVEENDMDVKFLGESTNVYSIMNNYDIIMGMGRCILEAIAMKKIAIISGYTSVGGLINKDNIELASKENFTDRYNNQDDKFKETLQKLISLTNDDINRITKENYDFAYKNLNYKKNIFVIDDKNILEYVAISNQTVFNLFSNSITHYENIINIKTKQIEKLKYENSTLLQEQIVDLQSGNNILQNEIELLQNKIKGLQNENILLRDELECIYNSRRWKYSSALAKLIKKH